MGRHVIFANADCGGEVKRRVVLILAITLAGCGGPPVSPVPTAAANLDPTGKRS
jgi:hypothetical protein